MKEQPQRIINTTSDEAWRDLDKHLEAIDGKDYLIIDKKTWTPYEAYGLSKLLVIMFTRGLWYLNISKRGNNGTTLMTLDPGCVNTKLLDAGWGKIGVEVDKAVETYRIATEA